MMLESDSGLGDIAYKPTSVANDQIQRVLIKDDRCRNSSELKFGIDKILSKVGSDTCHRKDVEFDVCCTCSKTCKYDPIPAFFHYYYPFDRPITKHQPPPYVPPSSFFSPAMRKYTNFIIEVDQNTTSNSDTSKRKRIWSRAVFSKLQRKGLEKRFQLQKYIMKPDRKQLAATLGLTDAQVKVWFQNRRMKWRNKKENSTNKNVAQIGTKQTH